MVCVCAKELNAINMNSFTTRQANTYSIFLNCEFHLFYGLWTVFLLIFVSHLLRLVACPCVCVMLVCYFHSRLVSHSVDHRRNNHYNVLLCGGDVKWKHKCKQTKFTPRKSFLGWFWGEEEMPIACPCTRTLASAHASKKKQRQREKNHIHTPVPHIKDLLNETKTNKTKQNNNQNNSGGNNSNNNRICALLNDFSKMCECK